MIEGIHFDGVRSRGRPARADLQVDGSLRIELLGGLDESGSAPILSSPFASVSISDRLAGVPRRLELPGLGTFETRDDDAVDRWLVARGRSPGLVHWLEDRWPVALFALVLVAGLTFLFVRYGVPAAAALAARELPPSLERRMGAQVFEALDEALLERSTLTQVRQMHLIQRFLELTHDLGGGYAYRFEIRSAPAIGANAFALPSGIIVMTDELVLLAKHDEELIAVLAHELGHVHGRHSLRMLLQSAGVSAIAAALIGDVGSASAVLGVVPMLLDAKHSRDFEREADAFARGLLARRAIDPGRFDAILCRMQAEVGDDDGVSRFLSSHPPTDERVRCADASDAAATGAVPRSGPPPKPTAPGW